MYQDLDAKPYDTMSEVLETYYAEKNSVTRIRQKSADLRHLVNTMLERESKKLDLQARQLKDTEKRDKFRLYGELLHTWGTSWSRRQRQRFRIIMTMTKSEDHAGSQQERFGKCAAFF